MNKPVAIAVVVLSVVCFVFMAPGIAGEQDVKTGSIKGKLIGFRSPEHVVVYVEKVPGEHPAPEEPVALDQVKLEFVPHVLPIVKGTTVRFHNHDPVSHNITWPACCNGAYPSHSLGMWDEGNTKNFTYDKEGKLTLLCKVHPRMEAHVVVVQNPFFATGSKKGTYEIKGVPPGEYSLQAWSPKPRNRKPKSAKVTVTAGRATVQDFSR